MLMNVHKKQWAHGLLLERAGVRAAENGRLVEVSIFVIGAVVRPRCVVVVAVVRPHLIHLLLSIAVARPHLI